MAKLPVSDLILKLQQVKANLQQVGDDIAVEAANNLKALAEKNIIEQGVNGGQKYAEYLVPAYFFWGRELNARGRRFLESKGVSADGQAGEAKRIRGNKKKGIVGRAATKEDRLTNWKEFRQAQGLPVAHVDLFYSGHMWHNIVVIRISRVAGKSIAELGGADERAQNELDYNAKRYGTFITNAVSADDTEFINQLAADRLTQAFKQAGI